MAEQKDELSEIKEDKLYDGDLSYEEIKTNPILQPIMEVNTLYGSMGLLVQRSVSEFIRLQTEILEMIDKNPIYSQTRIVAKMREIIMHSKNVIHAQDIQRINIKKAMNDMIKNNNRFYELKENLVGTEPEKKHSEEIIDREIKVPEKEEITEELFKKEETEEPKIPKKRGRPPKEKKKLSEEELNKEILG